MSEVGVWDRTRWRNPKRIAGLVMWLVASRGVTLAGTPRATGTTPPVVTLTGQLEQSIALRVEIQTTGARGAATFRWSVDGGTTWVQQNQVTAATFLMGSTGITLNFPAGTYTNDNVFVGTVASWNDQSGRGNHTAQATAAQQPTVRLANGVLSLGFEVANYGLTHTLRLEPPATIGFVAKRNTDGGFFQCVGTFGPAAQTGLYAFAKATGTDQWGTYAAGAVLSGQQLTTFKTCVICARAYTDFDLRTNGASVTAAGAGASSLGAFIGNDGNGGNQNLLGEIIELVAYNRTLLVPEMRSLERYLRWRAGTA